MYKHLAQSTYLLQVQSTERIKGYRCTHIVSIDSIYDMGTLVATEAHALFLHDSTRDERT